MRNPTLDLSPRTAPLDTNTTPQASRSTSRPPLGGDGFESTLPPEALDELRQRRRVAKTPRQRQIPPWLILAALAITQVLLLTAAMLVLLEPTSHSIANPATVVAQPTPTALPHGWNADGTAYGRAGVIPEVRRAELVPVTVKRATLMRLPAQEIGVYKWYALPPSVGGGKVQARFMGTVERFSDIPKNPTPDDMWNVVESNASWIFCTPLGYTHPVWIDP